MTIRLSAICALTFWVGATLLLGQVRWFARPGLVTRIRPYVTGAPPDAAVRHGALSVDALGALLTPVARRIGERLARVFGVTEELSVRLTRVHADLDVAGFRLRQLGWSAAAFGTTAVLAQVLPIPPTFALLAVVGAPLLAFLVVEQQLANASARWQRRLLLEMPVVAEQLGMLLAAGFSLGSALQRLATRGRGACARDLQRVGTRIGHGVDELDALREWSEVARVDALDRLVAVLALNREAGDLGGLITEEARTIRRDVQRETVETIERRAEQVWIPVTVATLLPGVLFLAVPFVEAMRLFGAA